MEEAKEDEDFEPDDMDKRRISQGKVKTTKPTTTVATTKTTATVATTKPTATAVANRVTNGGKKQGYKLGKEETDALSRVEQGPNVSRLASTISSRAVPGTTPLVGAWHRAK